MKRQREDWSVAEYLEAVRRGDSIAARRLDRCAKRLAASKAMALRLPREDAEEAAQGACLAALENDGAALLRVGASTPLSVWVAAVLDHDLLDRVKASAAIEAAAPSDRASQRAAQRARKVPAWAACPRRSCHRNRGAKPRRRSARTLC